MLYAVGELLLVIVGILTALDEIVAAIAVLADHPDMGRIVAEFEQPFLRELIQPPFRIVYRRDPKCVRIVRVWRSERALEVPDEELHGSRCRLDGARARWGGEHSQRPNVEIRKVDRYPHGLPSMI